MPSLLEYNSFLNTDHLGSFFHLVPFSVLPKPCHSYLITPIKLNSTTGPRKATVEVLIAEVICCPSFYTPSHAQRGHSCTIKHVLEPVLVHSSLPMHIAQTCQSKVTSFSAPNLWAAAQIHGCDSGSSRLANNSVSSPDLCKVTTPREGAVHPTKFYSLVSRCVILWELY